MELGQFVSAQRELAKAVEIDPAHKEALYNLFVAYFPPFTPPFSSYFRLFILLSSFHLSSYVFFFIVVEIPLF